MNDRCWECGRQSLWSRIAARWRGRTRWFFAKKPVPPLPVDSWKQFFGLPVVFSDRVPKDTMYLADSRFILSGEKTFGELKGIISDA